jgi:hypothetical protein
MSGNYSADFWLSQDTSVENHECDCSRIYTCQLCRSQGALDDHSESIQVDPVQPGGPAVPASYTASNDVNPVCGCHLRSKCMGCGVCTSCDGCYCYED